MIIFLFILLSLAFGVIGLFLGVVFADEIRERAARLTAGTGSHTAAALAAPAQDAEEAASVTSPAGEPRTALIADPGPVALPCADRADDMRERLEQAAEQPAEPAWEPPGIDVFAKFALACEDDPRLPPMRQFAAGLRNVKRVDHGTPPAGLLTGPLPAVPREQHRVTQPIRLPADDTQAAEMRAEYFGQPAAGHPCCRHCADGGGRCFIPDAHEVACIDCHAPAAGLSFECGNGLHAPVCDGRNCSCSCHRKATYGQQPVAAVLAGEAQAARYTP